MRDETLEAARIVKTAGYPSLWKPIAATAGLVALLGAWRLYDRRALPASIDDVLPLSATRVVIARRDERGWETGPYNDSYLELVDAKGGQLWRRVVPHASIDSPLSPFLHALVVAGDAHEVIVARGRVRSGTHDRMAFFAYTSTTGDPLWQATPFPPSDAFEPNYHASMLVAGADTVLVFANESDHEALGGQVVHIVALDARTGAERWRAKEDDSLFSAFRLRGNSLLVTTAGKVRVIELATGKDRASFAASYEGSPCVLDDEAWFVDANGLEELRFGEGADMKLHPHERPALEDFSLLGECGRRKGKVWFVAGGQRANAARELATKERWLVGLDPATDAPATLADLGAFERIAGLNDPLVATDLLPFAGELDRFVPLITSAFGAPARDAGDGGTPTLHSILVMLDLDQAGAVAWATAMADAIRESSDALWHAGNVDLYASIQTFTGSITSFDPATGQMVASLQRPEHGSWTTAYGQIWVDDEWRLAAFDATTMKETWSTGAVRTSPFTAQAKAQLAPVAMPDRSARPSAADTLGDPNPRRGR